ncbi:short-chain dehydrogenase [Brachybacterium phenoliresistens]|uniref:Short-chain dehydrogenase n=1 Tax=Brachybacterium phenoliresistens TaxID=396014 RepID=Z9JU97_9MICO|nr:short chain dehydrogenase [Brachybacterium phenoliresistens]EWS81568.1 short-chain dehydrogenase [Brachybacterium phenoliresistens]
MSRSRVLVVGASGLIGSTVADLLDQRGHEVVRSSRSSGERADLTDPASIEALFERIGPVDAVIAATGSVPFKPLPELGVEDFRAGILDKALGQIALVTLGAPRLRPGASFTLTSGILAQSPVATGAVASAANGAIDAFVRAAATTLPGGARINAVSPTVLAEAEGYHASFPGFVPVPAATVAQAFVRSVEGVETGQVFAV